MCNIVEVGCYHSRLISYFRGPLSLYNVEPFARPKILYRVTRSYLWDGKQIFESYVMAGGLVGEFYLQPIQRH